MIYRVAAALLVIVAIVGGALLLQRETQQQNPPAAAASSGTADLGYAARDAVVIETGADGRRLYTLRASLIRQAPRDQSISLTDVDMDFRDADGNPWTLRADEGTIRPDTNWVDLFGNVRVAGTLSDAKSPGGAATILTPMLSFDSRAEIVSTHAPVTLDWAGRLLRARGLYANLKDRRVRLESDVHGVFSP